MSLPPLNFSFPLVDQNGYASKPLQQWINTMNSGGTGSVTSVSGTGTVNGITLTGTVTSSGSLTLGGAFVPSPPAAATVTISGGIATCNLATNTRFNINATSDFDIELTNMGTAISESYSIRVTNSGGTWDITSWIASGYTFEKPYGTVVSILGMEIATFGVLLQTSSIIDLYPAEMDAV